MRSLIDLVGRRRTAAEPPEREAGPAEPPEPEAGAAGTPAGTDSDAERSNAGGTARVRTKAQEPPRANPEPANQEPGRREPTDTGAAERGRPEGPADASTTEREQSEASAGVGAAERGRPEGPAGAGAAERGEPADADAKARGDVDGLAPEPGGAAGTPARPAAAPAGRSVTRRRRLRELPVVLGVVTVLLGGTAAWCADEATRVRDASGGGNVALTDVAATSDVKGVVTDAVNTIFSFDYADMARTRQAADRVLTGDAVRQYDAMVAQVRAQAPGQKLVLTTTVTDSAVEMLQDGRARVLLFADQRSTRTVAKDTTYAAAMLAVDAVRRGGNWKISSIDTLTGRR